MKIASIAEIKANLSAYVRASEQSPVVVTRNGDIDALNRVLREEFVRIYSEPVLPNFLREQMKAHPDAALPALPPPGDLDIRQVISSPYFFA